MVLYAQVNFKNLCYIIKDITNIINIINIFSMKKLISGLVSSAAIVGMLALAAPAFAAGQGDGSKASACGAVHGAFADVNGNFGWLGPLGGTPGYHGGATGQEPGATGYNNSHTGCNA